MRLELVLEVEHDALTRRQLRSLAETILRQTALLLVQEPGVLEVQELGYDVDGEAFTV